MVMCFLKVLFISFVGYNIGLIRYLDITLIRYLDIALIDILALCM